MTNLLIITQISLELTCALMALIAFVITFRGKKTLVKSGIALTQMLIIDVFLMTADALAYAYRGNTTETGIYMTRVTNYLVYIFQFLVLLFGLIYARYLIEERGGSPVSVAFLRNQQAISALGIALVTVSQFTGFVYYFDSNNLYTRNSGIAITMGLALIGLLNGVVMLALNHKALPLKQSFSLLCFFLFPVISVILQTFIYGISFMNICLTLTLMVIFVVHETERIKLMEEQALQLVEQKKLLDEQKYQLITSQIQPHFLYNALATISSLCQIDPATAEKATNSFAEYLRMNLDTLNNSQMIPFTKELEHSKTYLWLEHLRFGDILNVEYDIQYSDFVIPPLIIQPLVENAVKHGIFPKEDGGTVTISTRLCDDYVEILIDDDGVGFDPQQKPDDSRSHIGLTNVKNRIETICGGTLTIQAREDVGTRVEIHIPKGEHAA